MENTMGRHSLSWCIPSYVSIYKMTYWIQDGTFFGLIIIKLDDAFDITPFLLCWLFTTALSSHGTIQYSDDGLMGSMGEVWFRKLKLYRQPSQNLWLIKAEKFLSVHSLQEGFLKPMKCIWSVKTWHQSFVQSWLFLFWCQLLI